MWSVVVVVALFAFMAYLRSQHRLTLPLAVLLATLAMWTVSFAGALENGQEVWKAAVGAVFFAIIVAGVVFGLLRLAGVFRDPGDP
jgi:hypothetical protein